MSSTEHHIGMRFTKHPDGRTEVEVHQMPLQGSGQAPQGVISAPGATAAPAPGVPGQIHDPMAAGAKSAMDAAMESMSKPPTKNSGVDVRQTSRLGGAADGQDRKVAKKPEAAVGKPPKTETQARPQAKPNGKLPAKNTEKDKGRAP